MDEKKNTDYKVEWTLCEQVNKGKKKVWMSDKSLKG